MSVDSADDRKDRVRKGGWRQQAERAKSSDVHSLVSSRRSLLSVGSELLMIFCLRSHHTVSQLFSSTFRDNNCCWDHFKSLRLQILQT